MLHYATFLWNVRAGDPVDEVENQEVVYER